MSEIVFRLPDVGEGLNEAEIVRWLVVAGDEVSRDQPIVEVETDKSIVELPSPADGTIRGLEGEPGDLVQVGDVLFVLEPLASRGADPQSGAPAVMEKKRSPVQAAPPVRKLARDQGVDLTSLTGTGSHGRITRADVEKAVRARREGEHARGMPSSVSADRSGQDVVVPLRGIRRKIAKTMVVAWREVPHITDVREIDATALVAARSAISRQVSQEVSRLTYLPFLIKVVVAALDEVPMLNASVDLGSETITLHASRNIGIATATDDGLIVPVLHDAQELNLIEIARRIDDLASKARSRSLTLEETINGTCTITNFGSYGGWIGTPIIRPPESAIVGFGRVADRVVPMDGEAVIRPVLPVSVSADHRIVDGSDVAEFLNRLTKLFTDSEFLRADVN